MQATRATSRAQFELWPVVEIGWQGQDFTTVVGCKREVATYQVAAFGESRSIRFGTLDTRGMVHIQERRGCPAHQVWRHNHD